jgi:hypothetical protein
MRRRLEREARGEAIVNGQWVTTRTIAPDPRFRDWHYTWNN